LIALVRKGKEAFQWNSYFYLIVFVVALASTIPCVLGIASITNFPFFSPAHDLTIETQVTHTSGSNIRVDLVFTTSIAVWLNQLTVTTNFLAWGTSIISSLLWVTNILGFILVKKELDQHYIRYLLYDEELQREFGVDISLRTISILLIIAQIPGIFLGGWMFFFAKGYQWHNPIVLQCCFGMGSSIQGCLNGAYFMPK